MRARKYSRVINETRQVLTIWDNYERHCSELRDIGATDEDLRPLKAAAEAVSELEDQVAVATGHNPSLDAPDGLAELTGPHTCANGWVINPPPLPARRWAMSAMLKVTGGTTPDDAVSQTYAILAALAVLRLWSDGRHDQAMQLVMASGKLAAMLPDLVNQVTTKGVDPESLAEDYMLLMGLADTQKKTPEPTPELTHARETYCRTLSLVRRMLSAPSTAASSTSTSPSAAPASASPGPTTSASPAASSTPSSGNAAPSPHQPPRQLRDLESSTPPAKPTSKPTTRSPKE